MMRRTRLRLISLGVAVAVAAAVLTAGPVAVAQANSSVTTPENVRVEDVSPTSATVRWDGSQSDVGGISYVLLLEYSYLRKFVKAPETELTLSLGPGTDYRVRVQAMDAQGHLSDWSDPLEFTTPNVPPPTVPENVRASIEPGSVTIDWDPSTADLGVAEYQVTMGSTTRYTTQTSASFDVPPGGEFVAKVRARDTAYRWSEFSDPLSVSVPPAEDWEPPTAPANFRATPLEGQEGVFFEWDASTGGLEPLTYHIHLDGTEIELTRDLFLESPYFVMCTSPWQMSATFVVTANSYGVQSPPSNSITLCFA